MEISPQMICSIASLAALGVDGIEATSMPLRDIFIDKLKKTTTAKGVVVSEDDKGYEIDVYVITDKNVIIPSVCRIAQIKVKDSVELMTGKPVNAVNMYVEGSSTV